MWSGQLNNQSGVLDVTIQCQLNMATRNLQEVATNISPAATGPKVASMSPPVSTDAQHYNTNCSMAPDTVNQHRTAESYYENITPTKAFSSCEYASDAGFTNVFMTPTTRSAFQPVHSSVKLGQNGHGTPDFTPCVWNNFQCQQQNMNQVLNDSGYGSPGFLNSSDVARSSYSNISSNNRYLCDSNQTSGHQPQNIILNSVGYEQQLSASCSFRGSFGPMVSIPGNNVFHNSTSATQNSSDSDLLDADMKIAMKEKDVTQRIFALKSKGYESAQAVEDFYHQQMTLIDFERHNILRQMAYDKTSSESINCYYNRKLLSILENVDQKLSELENSKNKKNQSQKKSRLLPKAAVKILESWYQENLSNPYPSREVTLTMASEGGITVEQIRKWFANKRNRSRNSKLKACDANE